MPGEGAMRSDTPPPAPPRDQDNYVPPPPEGFQPNSLRGVLHKQEDSVLGRKKWTKKFVICDSANLKYFANEKPDFSKREPPRKTLPVGSLSVGKLPVASRFYREHSFTVKQLQNDYVMCFAAENDEQRDEWMLFIEKAGGGRTRRLDSNIENEIRMIKMQTGGRETISSPEKPTLDIDKTINLLKFSNKPMSIHMLESTLCTSINTQLNNRAFASPEDSERLIEPIMELIKKVVAAQIAENASRAPSSISNPSDPYADEMFGDMKRDPLNNLLILLVRFLKHCIISLAAAEKAFSTSSSTQLYQHLAAFLEKPPSESFNKLRVTTAKLFLHVSASYPAVIPQYNIRSVVAVAGSPADNLRPTCMEILRLLLATRTETVSQCNGLRTIMEAVLDPSMKDYAEALMLSVMFVFSSPHTRRYLRQRLDISILFASYTDLDTEGNERTNKWKCSDIAITTSMRSFAGIIILSSDPSGIQSLMGLVSDDTVELAVQKAVLKTISGIFQPSLQLNDYLSKKNSNPGGKGGSSGGMQKQRQSHILLQHHLEKNARPALNLMDSYSSILCCAFIHAGLPVALTNLCVHDNSEVSQQALRLLADVMVVASRLLPEDLCNEILLMPELTYCATIVGGREDSAQIDKANSGGLTQVKNELGGGRQTGSQIMPQSQQKEMLRALERGAKASAVLRSLAMKLSDNSDISSELLNLKCLGGVVGLLRNSNVFTTSIDEDHVSSRRERMMSGLRESLELGMNKRMLESQLNNSGVEKSKDWREWEWETIGDILEDSLAKDSNRLADAMKNKFVKRLGGFFRCSSEQKGFFAHMEWSPKNIKYFTCACRFYEVLLTHDQGKEFLRNDRRGKVFEEIAKELAICVRHVETRSSGSPSPPSEVFDREKSTRQMTREYFAILGRMWSTQIGVNLEQKDKIFHLFNNMARFQELDYLSRIILTNLDYSSSSMRSLSPSQSLLQLYIQDSSVSLRLHAICILRSIIRSRVRDVNWAIDILTTRLQCGHCNEVNTAVLSVLCEAAAYPPYLDIIIQKNPHMIDHHLADSLFLKFASMSKGLDLLKSQHNSWFADAITRWKGNDSVDYVRKLEDSMARTLMSRGKLNGGTHPTKIPLDAAQTLSLQAHQDKFAGKELDLESLLRMPWVIDVVINQSQRSQFGSGHCQSLDTRLDVEEGNVVITGTYIDENGTETCLPCSRADCVHSSLFLGACPVKKDGSIGEPFKRWQSGGASGGAGMAAAFGVDRSSNLGTSPKQSVMKRFSTESSGSHGTWDGEGLGHEDDMAKCDWTTCSQNSRKSVKTYGRWVSGVRVVMINVQGEPATFFFREEKVPNGTSTLYLLKVEYTISLDPLKNAIRLPPHLFGELAKCDEGIDILAQHHVIEDLMDVVHEEDKGEKWVASLWSLAHICSAQPGLQLVRDKAQDFVPWLCKQAYKSEDYSFRGTAVCLLRLVAQTDVGAAMIMQEGWASSPTAGCPIPTSFSAFFSVDAKSWGGDVHFVGSPVKAGAGGLNRKLGKREENLLTAVGKLGDHITQKEAMAALKKMRMDKSMEDVWGNGETIAEIHEYMGSYAFDLQSRRLLWECLGVS
ncbi:hypothetical protein TrRE_jg10745 [Triparma retinervis]|uniref:PH domain-containing protein n=1 Tax=Triparma retinervis TaxID=2557542 RepID=A0A9W7KTD8_9STRA|nr:hypothetical protein TrRE_jg10745 [Triparma retinervis]